MCAMDKPLCKLSHDCLLVVSEFNLPSPLEHLHCDMQGQWPPVPSPPFLASLWHPSQVYTTSKMHLLVWEETEILI